jgi:hypothetical protein
VFGSPRAPIYRALISHASPLSALIAITSASCPRVNGPRAQPFAPAHAAQSPKILMSRVGGAEGGGAPRDRARAKPGVSVSGTACTCRQLRASSGCLAIVWRAGGAERDSPRILPVAPRPGHLHELSEARGARLRKNPQFRSIPWRRRIPRSKSIRRMGAYRGALRCFLSSAKLRDDAKLVVVVVLDRETRSCARYLIDTRAPPYFSQHPNIMPHSQQIFPFT